MTKIHTIPLHEQKKGVLRAAQLLKQVMERTPPTDADPAKIETFIAQTQRVLQCLEAAMSTLAGLEEGKDMRENL